MVVDRFGITQLYPSVGLEWFNKWSGGLGKRTIDSGGMDKRNEDPKDHWISLHCPSYKDEKNRCTIDGTSGIAKLSGMHPRLYIRNPDLSINQSWLNTEMTCYCRIVATYPPSTDPKVPSGSSYTVFRLISRSNHHKESPGCICNGLGYNSEWFLGGGTRFRKELMHHAPGLSHYANAPMSKVNWVLSPANKPPIWIGHKFITRTINKGTKVQLDAYVDYNNGVNGGKWVKIGTRVDAGDWPVSLANELKGIDKDMDTCDKKGSACIDKRPAKKGGPYNKIILRKGGTCGLRTDWVKESHWKHFSIREIAAVP